MTQYIHNTWYPLTWARNLEQSISRHRVIEEDIVAYRDTKGQVVALRDLCPHKMAPLSIGTLQGDAIQCGYHGLRFNCTGQCVHVPGQDRIPPSIRVHAYPTWENMGMVWIWMGDPALADETAIYDLPEYRKDNYSYIEGDSLRLEANYLNLADNLCDPSHVAFVHTTTLSNANHGIVPVHHEVEGSKVTTWRWILDSPIIPIFRGLKNYQGNVDRWHYYHYYAPCIAIIDFGSAPTGQGAPEGDRSNCIQMWACHFITPVDKDTCIQHWLLVKNIPSDPDIDATLLAGLRTAFNEDKLVLEAIQKNENKYPDFRRTRLSIDASTLKMRRIVDKIIEAEIALAEPETTELLARGIAQ
ncbi:aromatic ring-hydroxylating dioxygenase subunit alpha [Pseudomonas profundi]|uniref:aromatic ring-hydroxylating dioxygenase subunit alpha n=1 Tax=Pseudomonas profundi TaxID=1981513 RepID=UPI001239330A|nr:aromatic ring-hydroxylating dioxygenase subunit alpha [Pseudomonas profundi]